MNNIFNLVDEMESYFDTCKKVLISNKLMVDMEVIYEFMTDLRLKLPEEIKRAERIIEEKDRILLEAKSTANNVEKEAESRLEKLVNEHEIVKKAYEESEKILAEAKNTAREMKLGAYEYVDEIISNLESAVNETINQCDQTYNRYSEYMKKQLEVLSDNRRDLEMRRNGKESPKKIIKKVK